MMTGRTPGGLLLPNKNALEFAKRAPWPMHCEEPPAPAGGLRIDAGYLSPYFITDPGRCLAGLDDAFVLAAANAIVTQQDLVPILEKVAQSGQPLLIVAPAVGEEVLALLVLNKLRGILRVCAVALKDIGPVADHLGCRIIPVPLARCALTDLGSARHISSGIRSTVIVRS
ncbi:MAG: hypothetical protein EPN25_15315 [Nitrospirae bacterium]|nr:MAG: hypothetical protein EPN25_15315 [Nitrospirota bacterium]